jgi:hypothetical protein
LPIIPDPVVGAQPDVGPIEEHRDDNDPI